MAVLAAGSDMRSVTQHLSEKFGDPRVPSSVFKYLQCCPAMDFQFRILPSPGGLYDQRHRDMVEFSIIESKLREVVRRSGGV